MSSKLAQLYKKKLVMPPKWLIDNVQYEVITGSYAYGIANDKSDLDIYGWGIPTKSILFPHTAGHILGFDNDYEKFEQYQQHHIKDEEASIEYDFTIYNIVKYFTLVRDNNPNMIDTLFVPQNCILHCTKIAALVRRNRQLFLHKGAYHKFLGYAHSQLHKMATKNPIGKRKELYDKYGFDTKFASHLVRLAKECEQILESGDLDLQRDAKLLKSIRNGEWSEQKIRDWFSEKETYLEKLYHSNNSKLPHRPDNAAIKDLLTKCLEMHYGDISDGITKLSKAEQIIVRIRELIEE